MIKARNIIKSYRNGESRFQVLKNISLDIEDNDFVVILGASGSGKSSFLNVISGLERPDSGNIRLLSSVFSGISYAPVHYRTVPHTRLIVDIIIPALYQKEKGFLKLIQKSLRYKEIFLYATNMIRITGA